MYFACFSMENEKMNIKSSKLEQVTWKGAKQQIDAWFQNEGDWDQTEEEKEKQLTMYPPFLERNIESFWDYFDLIDIISLCLAFKNMAYFAYQNNIKGFRTFCHNAWYNNELYLVDMPFISTDTLRTLNTMFRHCIKTITYQSNITNEVLRFIPEAENFTFYFDISNDSIQRPHYAFMKYVNLTLHGSYDTSLQDPTIDTLLTFPKITDLTIYNTYFNRASTTALSSVRVENLILVDCTLQQRRAPQFIQALVNTRHSLQALTILKDLHLVGISCGNYQEIPFI